MEIKITKDDIDYALSPSPWDLGNQVLYNLCQDYPRHDRGEEIIAKVWLIGRSYAAAIERHKKNVAITSDDFYETTVVKALKNNKSFSLDKMLGELPEKIKDPWGKLGQAVKVHKELMERFSEITDLGKRSLASKYLHFHRPDMFFLYDSRARMAVAKVTPSIKQIAKIKAEKEDPEYLTFCRRCQWLHDYISGEYKIELTPRQLDKILLRIADRIRKAHTNP